MNLEIKNETGEVIAVFKQKNQNLKIKVSDKFEPGAILTDCWGYEQTNYDFYVILERKGSFVKIHKLLKNTSKEIDFMSNDETPVFIPDLKEKPIRKKIKSFEGKETGFSLRDYTCGGWCSLWDGKPKRSTHYA